MKHFILSVLLCCPGSVHLKSSVKQNVFFILGSQSASEGYRSSR